MNASPTARLTLASHALCPYVQRAAIVLAEKGVPFERREVDLAAKPAWFRAVSPLGKTPVLLVDGRPIFESAVICEYLDETAAPRLHPVDAIERAQHRSWIEFGSQLLNGIAALYSAADEAQLEARRTELAARFAQLEAVLGDGPYFAGTAFSIVDAAFAPVFRYFDTFERFTDLGLFERTPKLRRWRAALALRPSVRDAVRPTYPDRLLAFLRLRGSALSRRIEAATA
jgi:glutathione S-transferase